MQAALAELPKLTGTTIVLVDNSGSMSARLSRKSHMTPKGLGYMINVASNRNGVGYGNWLHVGGWSDAVVCFITEYERADGARERVSE
ncbi:MAG: hypothetical protein JWO52_5250 [Gammaproteobacteria bacterium]|nr:hypothetical protein [Gammaproteobacteria bacterium]